jgi:hypothetical protein
MAQQDPAPLNITVTPLYNGRFAIGVGDAPSLEVTRWYRLEADHYVATDGLPALYFMSKSLAEAHVAAAGCGTVHRTWDDRLVTVEWELPNGGCLVDLSDVIDYVRMSSGQPEFFVYHRL